MQAVTFGRRGLAPSARPSPAQSAPPPSVAPEMVEAQRRFVLPWATGAILAVLAGVFLVETAVSAAMGHPLAPSHGALLKLGGVSGELVLRRGQVWRILTAALLHANLAHLIGNGVALLLVGVLLEPIIGWRWFSAIYLIGGLGGAIGSLSLNPGAALSVGASGAIMGVLACALVLSFHIACYDRRKRMRYMSIRVGVPALLPLSTAAGHVDYSAHLGGVIAGAIMGFLLQIIWDEEASSPPLKRLAGGFSVLVVAASLLTFGLAQALPTSAVSPTVTAGLVPIDAYPDSNAEAMQRIDDLLQRYPADPRIHALAAARWIKAGANGEAEAELSKALDSPLATAPELPADSATTWRLGLIALYLKDHNLDDARAAAMPLCVSTQPMRPQVRLLLNQLCKGSG